MAFLNSQLRPGIEIIMDITHFSDRVSDVDLVITGEGSTDYQTLFGKVPFGIGQIAKRFSKPVICISGSLGENYEQLYDAGITALFSLTNKPMTLKEAMERGEELLEKTAENVFRVFLI
jgi:glycerate kinase